MPYVSLAVPPGVFRQGTEYQTKGRAYDANLVRWYGAAIGPIRGWRIRSSSAAAMSGKARSIISWRDNSHGRWAGCGTHTGLYAINSAGQPFSIAPTDFVAGNADATNKTGFGYGVFGAGTYGTPRPDTGSIIPATVWDLDNWGEYLVGCAESDGRLLQWTLNTGTKAAVISGAPTSCLGLSVTSERALVALGAGGNPRLVQWSDLENNTSWSPSSTNKAGDFELATRGQILAARRMPDQHFVLTDTDAHSMTYVGDVYVYGFRRVGDGCGGHSRRCMAVLGNQVVWWGQQGFWAYDGAVRFLGCDVLDYVQNNLNNAQRSKITCYHNIRFGEIWWFYPSNSGTENDSYVVWDYRANTWNIGTLSRLCAVETGVFTYPIAVDSSGYQYEHEVGSSYGGSTPYVRLGPFEIAAGDRVASATELLADEATQGLATVYFKTRFYPNSTEYTTTTYSPPAAGNTSVRFQGRQLELVVQFSNDNTARWGSPRLAVDQRGRR